jgi:hypothetical protein
VKSDRPRVAKAAAPAPPVAPPAAKPPAPVFYFIEVLNGSKRSEAKFNAEEKR